MHGKEPPPKEILENTTAKGGDLLQRTTENFKPMGREIMANGKDDEDSAAEDAKTPKEEKMDIDDPGSGAGRTTRGLFFLAGSIGRQGNLMLTKTRASSSTSPACAVPAGNFLIKTKSAFLQP